MTGLPGRLVAGRYEIDNVVNAGASTIITEAIDTELDRPVTVKIVRPELATSSAFRAAFAERAAVATSLSHPNIAATFDAGEVQVDESTTLFWVVEYLGGGSLRDIFDRGRLLAPSQALVVGLEACRALDAAHSRGLVHTEITPSKLVFGTDGRLRIVDFAMAELMGAEAWSEPATVPTHVARYASPEQALALDVDAKTDIYALSLCLFEAVTGNVPFAGDSTVSTLAARVGKLMPVTADMGSLAAVLERGGRPDPEDRWTAAEFAQALVQAAETLPRPEPVPVLSASLFASSLAARHAAAAAAEAAAVPADVVDEPGDEAAADSAVADADGADVDEPSDGTAADAVDEPTEESAAAGDPVTDTGAPSPGAEELVLLTGLADPPTGAVQVATGDTGAPTPAEPPSGAEPRPDLSPPAGPATTEMPMSVAAAATTAPTTENAVVESAPGEVYDDQRAGRGWSRRLAFGGLALVGVIALAIAAWLLLRTKSYEVPDLVGVDEAVALNEISGNGWEIETVRERSDEVPEEDHVIRTEPAAGERLDEGGTFVLYVSDGPEFRTVPDLTGEPLDDATAALEELGLVVAETDREYSETVPADAVISLHVQGAAASSAVGAEVLPGTVIEMTVSRGPEPRPAPDLTNMTPEEARAALEAVQLVYAAGEEIFSNDIEAGRVATQNPAPTTAVERGGTVTVQISKGPDLVAVPDLSGMTYPDAQTALAAAGFTINSLTGTTEGTFVSISVSGAEASAGDTFPRGTAVDLIFL